MNARAAKKSAFADDEANQAKDQAANADSDFASRLAAAMGDEKQADVARRAGIRPQMLSEYVNRKRGPGADAVFALADAVRVNPRWLFLGEGPMRERILDTDTELVMLRHFRLGDFGDEGRPEPWEVLPIRAEWLAHLRTTKDVWLTEMPSDAFPEVAKAGDPIICKDPDQPLMEGKIYIFKLDGQVIVRRLQIRPDGLLLKATSPDIDPTTIGRDEIERLVPIARVLAAFNLQAV